MVGEKIKLYLKEHGIAQTHIAKRAGISKARLYNYLNKGREPDCIIYYKICKELKVPYEYFMEDIE